jgi:GLPGLI family protein
MNHNLNAQAFVLPENKGFLFVIFFFICIANHCYGQTNVFIVDFIEISNTSRSGKFYHQLVFDNNTSIFKQSKPFQSKNDFKDTQEGRSFRVDIPFSNNDLDIYKRNRGSDMVRYRHNFSGVSLYVNDTISHKWELSNESKTILNYNCKKATTQFRGRTYDVWFTLDINYPYGPWKIFGLPGLILEVHDQQGGISFYAQRLEIKNTLLDKIVKQPHFQIKESEFSSFYQYCQERKEILKRNRKIIESKMPNGMRFSQNCEDCLNELETCD